MSSCSNVDLCLTSITVPDLAFSEMDFLQRSSRHISSMKEDKASSKSREKEKRKAARAQDEISTFFKPNRMPLQPIPLNQGNRAPSTYTRDRLSGSGNSDLMDHNYLNRCKERSESFYNPEKPTIDFQRSRPASDILSTPVRRSQIAGPQSDASKLSGRATTCISWSETQISQEAKSQDLRKLDRTGASPSSESVLRSLENTGIFRDTGISMAARRAAVSSHALEQPFKYDQMRTTETSARTTSTLQSTERVLSRDRLRSDGLTSPHSDHRPDLREGIVASNPKDGIPQVRDCEMKRERVIIEHFDPSLGWHERQTSDGHGPGNTTTAKKRDIPEQSKSAPLDRYERAQRARIDRPSTTVPLPRSSLTRGEASTTGGLGNHPQGNALVEPEPKQRISASGIVEANSPSNRMKLESGRQDLTQTQFNEPKPLGILSGHHDENDQYVSGLTSTRSELHAPSCPQMLDAETNSDGCSALNKTVETIQSNVSYLGLPVRGFAPGQGLSNSAHQNHHSILYQLGREPQFIHELQRQPTPYEPSHYEDHLRQVEYEEYDILPRTEANEVEDFPYSHMPREAPFSNFYTTTDNYVDNVSQHAYDGFDGFDGHDEGHIDAEIWNLSPHVDMGMENYEVEELVQQNYQESLVTEHTQRQQLFAPDYNPSEGGVYGQYGFSRNDEEQVFWHPHRQSR
jgi:hypothetical protein